MSPSEPHIILFDGVCNLCNNTVQFLIKRDPEGKFKFASLQSEAGQELLRHFDLSTRDFETFIYIIGDECYTRSTAALRVLNELGGLWRAFYMFMLIPKPIRNSLYRVISKNRYRWFGKRDSCMVPTPERKERFLE